nr:HD domain-containing protein [Calditerricola satsumensis]
MKLSLLPEEKVFKDPVHDYIHVRKQFVWDLINTRAFQRLRRIKQMGTSDLTFHGAVHTRFAHSLGAYEVMRKLLNYLSRFWSDQPDDFVAVAYAAALLHDIGHGPFSHAFEKAIGSRHEEWTQRIIREDEEIAAILAELDPSLPDEVARVYDKTQPVRYPLIRQLIASQLDVDRMDYLLRDAVSTGVTYGRFELERMFRIMSRTGRTRGMFLRPSSCVPAASTPSSSTLWLATSCSPRCTCTRTRSAPMCSWRKSCAARAGSTERGGFPLSRARWCRSSAATPPTASSPFPNTSPSTRRC